MTQWKCEKLGTISQNLMGLGHFLQYYFKPQVEAGSKLGNYIESGSLNMD